MVEKCIDGGVVEKVAGFVFEKGPGRFACVGDALRFGLGIAWYPKDTAGIGCRAPEYRFLFDDDHLQTEMRRNDEDMTSVWAKFTDIAVKSPDATAPS